MKLTELKNRFSRQIKAGFNQAKISKQRCAVVGVGGLGTIVSEKLAMLGVKELILIDMDMVDKSNLNRQFFYEKDLGRYKVDATKEKLEQFNSNVWITKQPKPVQDVESALKPATIIFDCLDNIETRQWLNKYCVKNKKVLVHGGCSDVIGEIQIYIPGKTSCLECLPYPEDPNENRSCADFDAAICTTNGIVANKQIDMFIDWLHNKIKFNWISYSRNNGMRYRNMKINTGCKICHG